MRWSIARANASIPLFALFAACDIPTALPKWNTTFEIPAERTTVSVQQLLPASIQLNTDGSAFLVLVGDALPADVHAVFVKSGAVIDSSNVATVASAVPYLIEASAVTVAVTRRQITAAPMTLDLTRVDDFVVDQARSGALLLTVDNPFGVNGNLILLLHGAREVAKSVSLAAGRSEIRVVLDTDDVDALLQREVTISLFGPVDASSPVTLSPGQKLSVEARLQLVIGARE